MSDLQFEPFGEQVDRYASGSPPTSLQGVVSRVGIGIFWMLVAGIVIARAMFFDPEFAQTFVAYLATGVHALFG